MRIFKTHDVFISYAIEEKHTVAETLASCLEKKKIKVWYAGNELKVGDSISSAISKGLRKSNYFILILSPSYKRNWTFLELHTFMEEERQEKKILILPVWHGINYEEAKAAHPEIADRYAVSTDKGLEVTCQLLYESILSRKKEDRAIAGKKMAKTGLTLIAFFTVAFFLYRSYCTPPFKTPSKALVEAIIQKQTAGFQAKLSNNLRKKIMIAKGEAVPMDSVIDAYNRFIGTSNRERNEYRFWGEAITVSGSKNIEALGIPASNAPYNAYGISSPACYVLQNDSRSARDTVFHYSFVLINQAALAFSIDTLFGSEEKLHACVTYEENIRSIEGDFMYPVKAEPIRKQVIRISGYKPSEEYVFELKNGVWNISEVK